MIKFGLYAFLVSILLSILGQKSKFKLRASSWLILVLIGFLVFKCESDEIDNRESDNLRFIELQKLDIQRAENERTIAQKDREIADKARQLAELKLKEILDNSESLKLQNERQFNLQKKIDDNIRKQDQILNLLQYPLDKSFSVIINSELAFKDKSPNSEYQKLKKAFQVYHNGLYAGKNISNHIVEKIRNADNFKPKMILDSLILNQIGGFDFSISFFDSEKLLEPILDFGKTLLTDSISIKHSSNYEQVYLRYSDELLLVLELINDELVIEMRVILEDILIDYSFGAVSNLDMCSKYCRIMTYVYNNNELDRRNLILETGRIKLLEIKNTSGQYLRLTDLIPLHEDMIRNGEYILTYLNYKFKTDENCFYKVKYDYSK